MFVEIDYPKGERPSTLKQLRFTNYKIKKFEPTPILGQHAEEIIKGVLRYTQI